jgi:hypothetical protein
MIWTKNCWVSASAAPMARAIFLASSKASLA